MKAKFSPLQLLDFKLIRSEFEFIVPDEEDLNVRETFGKYEVDIDFGHEEYDGEALHLAVSIDINQGEDRMPGYVMSVGGIGVFKLDQKAALDEKTRGNLLYYSTLNMMINNLRNIMYQQSNLGPLGAYILPPIDIVDLVGKKVGKENE